MATHPKLRTVSGEPVRAFALGGNRETRQRSDVVTEAYARGVNYFFAYSMDGDVHRRLPGRAARPLLRPADAAADLRRRGHGGLHGQGEGDGPRREVPRAARHGLRGRVLHGVRVPGDEDAAIDAVEWMRGEGGLVVADRPGARAGIDGPVRFVGCSTHDRCVGVKLLRSEEDALTRKTRRMNFKPSFKPRRSLMTNDRSRRRRRRRRRRKRRLRGSTTRRRRRRRRTRRRFLRKLYRLRVQTTRSWRVSSRTRNRARWIS